MLTLSGQPVRNCEGISRRSLLKIGTLGLGGITLADMLAMRAAAATNTAGKSAIGAVPRKTSVIFFELAGGPTHFETYDPKPGAPEEYRGPMKAIDTALAGVQFCEVLPEQAKIADKLAIIRSIHHTNGSHGTSAHLTQTGYYLRDNQNRANEMPCAGSIVSRLRGANVEGMPSYVSMPRAMRFGQSGWLGKAFNPFVVDRDPSQADFKVNNLFLEGELTLNRLDTRRDLLAALDHQKQIIDNDGVSASLDQFTRQAFEMLTTDRAREAFDLTKESESMRDRYGRTLTGQSLLLARRLVESGVTFVTVRMNESWDDHGNIAGAMRKKGPAFDRGLAALVSDVYERGLDQDVMIVAMGEFGRTPRVNKSGGRDHWGGVMSVMMSGGGLRVGQIIGSSTAKGEVPHDNPYRPENVLATMYRHLGIDPSNTFDDLTGRPRYILERRELIQELV
jgi:hypothetical protein